MDGANIPNLKAWYEDDLATLYLGDCLDVLRQMPDESVHCCVTSPPYFGLRDYGTAEWEGGREDCDHKGEAWTEDSGDFGDRGGALSANAVKSLKRSGMRCRQCGAVRVDRQIGLEATPQEFVAKMAAVFAEVRRVLRSDGTLWLNLGDSYAGSWGNYHPNSPPGKHGQRKKDTERFERPGYASQEFLPPTANTKTLGLKPKDLMGMPWRVAFALQEAGWWLRQDIIWSKPNPMPESVTDRCTKAHEYIFLLSKSARYFYDAEAVKESATFEGKTITLGPKSMSKGQAAGMNVVPSGNGIADVYEVPAGRNKRSVWEVSTAPFPEAHFATFPPKLIEPCILAGTSEKGVCATCGAPWVRKVEKSGGTIGQGSHDHSDDLAVGQRGGTEDHKRKLADAWESGTYKVETLGWETSCDCSADIVPATVLDPFAGAGTTLLVAKRQRRRSIGIELNPEYCGLIKRRLEHWYKPHPPKQETTTFEGTLFEGIAL